jgi:hypothetical protein
VLVLNIPKKVICTFEPFSLTREKSQIAIKFASQEQLLKSKYVLAQSPRKISNNNESEREIRNLIASS